MKFIRKIVVYVLCTTITALPWHGTARATTTGQKDAAAEAKRLGPSVIGTLKGSTQQYGSDIKLMTPQNKTEGALNADQVADLMGIHQNDKEYTARGDSYRGALYERANRLNESGSAADFSRDPDAAAYSLVMKVHSLPKNALDYDDPMFKKSDEIIGDIDSIAASFADCRADSEYFKAERVVHVPELEQCSTVVDKSGTCTISHNYTAGAVTYYSGPYNINSCGTGCTQVWIGRVGDNYWSGWCSVFEETTKLKVLNPGAIRKATLIRAKWDDYMQVWVGPEGKEKKVWSGPNGNFPPETAGACELSTSWDQSPNVDVTQQFKSTKEGGVLSFKIRVSVSGKGEGYGLLRIEYDPNKTILYDEWSPSSCVEAGQAIEDGFAKGSIVCDDMPTTDKNGCATMNGVYVCRSHLKKAPLNALSPLCRKATVKADYNFYKGPMECYKAADGSEVCLNNSGGNLDQCAQLAQSGCVYISGDCTDGAKGTSGNCYTYTNTYDCGYDQVVSSPISNKTTQCEGDLACTGTDCMDTDYSASQDFARVAAMLNVAQQAAKDMNCTGQDDDGKPLETENIVCTLFSGNAGECKVAVGGIQDCCEKPKGVSVLDYIVSTYAIYRADQAIMAMNTGGEGIIGAFQSMQTGVTDAVSAGFNAVTKPIASYAENISGAVKEFVDPVKQVFDQVMEEIKKKIAEMFQQFAEKMGINMGAGGGAAGGGAAGGSQAAGGSGAAGGAGGAGAAAGGAAEAAGAEAATSGMLSALGTCVTVVGYVYMAYVVAMMIIQTVFKCEQEEYELASNRALKQCHYVGSYCRKKVLGACIEKRYAYCCYKSPLGRILQEQIRQQLPGRPSFGTAKNPECDGLTLEEFSNVDWDRVNLDEWIALQQEAGNFGGKEENLSMDALTGAGSALDISGDRKSRLNAEERVDERLGKVDIDGIRQGLSENIFIDTGKSSAPAAAGE